MGESNLLKVNISIGDRKYTLNIKPEQEELVRAAARKSNELIYKITSSSPGRDVVDITSFALLQLALKVVEHEQDKELDNLQEDIKVLNAQLTNYLK